MNKKKIRLHSRLILLLLMILILGVSSVIFFTANNKKSSEGLNGNKNTQELMAQINFPAVSRDQQIGTTESIMNNDDRNSVSVHYPSVGIEGVDSQIQNKVDQILQQYNKGKKGYSVGHDDMESELWVDYSSYVVGDNLASVVYHQKMNFSVLANPEERVSTQVFNLKNQKELSLDDVLKGNYLPVLCSYAKTKLAEDEQLKQQMDSDFFEHGIAPEKENYSNFALKKDAIIIYFEKYQLFSGSEGEQSVEIPFSELSDYLKIDTSGKLLEAMAPPETSQQQAPAQSTPDVKQPETQPVDAKRPMIALTFDDGPSRTITPRILDILSKHNARATFFVLGNRVDSYSDVLQREYEEGHEIGSHTFSHPSLTKINAEDINYQINETDTRISHLIPYSPTLLRPPYGALNDAVKASIQKPLVLWSVDTQDWKSRDRDKIVQKVIGKVQDGDIILMHDIYSSTAEACEVMIPQLVEQGFQLVTVSELLQSREITPTIGGVYSEAIRNNTKE